VLPDDSVLVISATKGASEASGAKIQLQAPDGKSLGVIIQVEKTTTDRVIGAPSDEPARVPNNPSPTLEKITAALPASKDAEIITTPEPPLDQASQTAVPPRVIVKEESASTGAKSEIVDQEGGKKNDAADNEQGTIKSANKDSEANDAQNKFANLALRNR